MSPVVMILEYLSWATLGFGTIFCIIGGIGILRLPDFYCRTHGASITDTMGAGLVLAGLLLISIKMIVIDPDSLAIGSWIIPVKILFLGAFIFLSSPTSGHALVKAAYADGISWTTEEEANDAASD